MITWPSLGFSSTRVKRSGLKRHEGGYPNALPPIQAEYRSSYPNSGWPLLCSVLPFCPLWPIQTAGMLVPVLLFQAFLGAFLAQTYLGKLDLRSEPDCQADVAVRMGHDDVAGGYSKASLINPCDHNQLVK